MTVPARTALLLSPHLDDVAFSCGGIAARLADAGWRTVLATVFTRSVLPPTGFALACQLDKGLPPELDYMALRRAEDLAAAAALGAEPRHLDLPEAPHRGYHSAAALFGPYVAADDVAPALTAVLGALLAELAPALVLAPQALGNHVDHHRVVDAVAAIPGLPVLWYRDAPYAMRNPDAQPADAVSGTMLVVDVAAGLDRKLRAATAYASQLGFQFGGAAQAEGALRAFAVSEAGGEGLAERVCCSGATVAVADIRASAVSKEARALPWTRWGPRPQTRIT